MVSRETFLIRSPGAYRRRRIRLTFDELIAQRGTHQAVLDDIKRPLSGRAHLPMARATAPTDPFAGRLPSGQDCGREIHTSSLNAIRDLDAKKYPNGQLIVHHKNDACPYTSFSTARSA